MPVALVTDSTASLSQETAERRGVRVVPLQVVIGGTAHEEGSEAASPRRLAAALRDRRRSVSTSRPGPEVVLAVYEQLVREGHDEIVSVHISGELSGTVESARLAARRASVPVHVVDTRQVGMGTGFAVLSAADALAAGEPAARAAEVARARGEATTSLFYVDTLEHLRRGGRVGAAAALVGSALAVKPILRLTDGRVGAFEKVRTAGKALQRLEVLATEAATGPVDVAVAHLESEERATALVSVLGGRLAEQLEGRDVALVEIGAVLGAHVGPGMVAVVVAPRPPQAGS
ncbi:DegV family protein [Nocardioides aurantiacus]|uniref:DegV family protein with EDD domain n=1 Tax=Nocardioides aurantiacus TaxID=86796 RepID=A0A3N2CVQ2_9ACTN|nr:DegV family protein [Nocardioides aurantiacus]ROR91607.1 DegV family protein with EDD domain [Nocardioides aurantiacus]